MKVGTKSVLFGAHCFLIHPFFVMAAWWKLYGFPNKIQYWVAFFVHDLGYWGKPNMDGPEGEEHVIWGAKVMGKLFGKEWYNFTILHSRFYAKKFNLNPSKLCMADKLAICLEPWWLYLPRVILSGEIKEYMKLADKRSEDGEPRNKYESMKLSTKTRRDWFEAVKSYLKRWVEEHKDGKEDTWTGQYKTNINQEGVWK